LSNRRKPPGRAARPASRATLSGLDYFRRIQSGEAPRAAMLELLGMRLLEVEAGRVVFGVTPSEQHSNAMGIAHGGLAATLLDSALGCAINTLAPVGTFFTTLELKVNFTRPIRVENGPLRCEARVIHMGRRTATSEGRIVDARGKIYAHGTTTCIVVDTETRRKPRTTTRLKPGSTRQRELIR
jgi:uncharacterized protein (TIGR00369 family)